MILCCGYQRYSLWRQDYLTGISVYIHLFLTDSCNLACSYCRGKIFETPDLERNHIHIESDIPAEVSYNLSDLSAFLSRDPNPVVTFIGGEPTLRADLIYRIVMEHPQVRFMLQTNGLLLHQFSDEILRRFDTILISIDGDQMTTDAGRGDGTYRQVMENIHHILNRGYTGEIIGRMTVHDLTDIYQSVMHLAHNPDYSFSSVHWQIDANFWNDFHVRRFQQWSEESYIPGISSLIEIWVRQIEETGIVERWYPFIDPVEDMLLERQSRLRCGSGYANYTVLTNGKIALCPIMVGMADYYVGDITTADPTRLAVIPVPGPCNQCDIFGLCGGRCLYSAIMEPWPPKGRELVCDTVRSLFDGLTGILPRIQHLLDTGAITMDQFAHEKFNGCEIIP